MDTWRVSVCRVVVVRLGAAGSCQIGAVTGGSYLGQVKNRVLHLKLTICQKGFVFASVHMCTSPQ